MTWLYRAIYRNCREWFKQTPLPRFAAPTYEKYRVGNTQYVSINADWLWSQ